MAVLEFNKSYSFVKNENFLNYLFAYFVVVLYFLLCAAIRRNHDLGNSGLTRNSLFGSEYIFKKGESGPNRFGSDPCQDYLTQMRGINYE